MHLYLKNSNFLILSCNMAHASLSEAPNFFNNHCCCFIFEFSFESALSLASPSQLLEIIIEYLNLLYCLWDISVSKSSGQVISWVVFQQHECAFDTVKTGGR